MVEIASTDGKTVRLTYDAPNPPHGSEFITFECEGVSFRLDGGELIEKMLDFSMGN